MRSDLRAAEPGSLPLTVAKGDAARIWIGAWPTIALISTCPRSQASFGQVLDRSQEHAWEAHRLRDSLANKQRAVCVLMGQFSNCCLKCKIF